MTSSLKTSLRYHITLSLTKCTFNKVQWAILYNRWLTVISIYTPNAVSWSKLVFKLPLFVSTNQYWCSLNTIHQWSEDLQITHQKGGLSTEKVLFITMYSEVCSEKLTKDWITLTDQRLLTIHTQDFWCNLETVQP